jgi:hypothetical protein
MGSTRGQAQLLRHRLGYLHVHVPATNLALRWSGEKSYSRSAQFRLPWWRIESAIFRSTSEHLNHSATASLNSTVSRINTDPFHTTYIGQQNLIFQSAYIIMDPNSFPPINFTSHILGACLHKPPSIDLGYLLSQSWIFMVFSCQF